MRRRLAIGAAALAALIALPAMATGAAAHPLGNFTVNHYTGLVVGTDRITVDLVVDSAEIPAFQRRGEVDTNNDKTIDANERMTFGAAECAKEVNRLDLAVAARSAALTMTGSALEFPPGAAGLDTMRLSCTAEAAVRIAGAGTDVTLVVRRDDARLGWREVTAQGDGTTLTASSVPAISPSKRLTAYPEDLLQSPLDVTSASVTARPGGPRAAARFAPAQAPSVRGVDRATAAFTDFIGRRELSPLIGLAAFALALLLGAIHALAPGHGKTVMAAFIVGERGSLRQAWVIALTVTVTHTAGVLVLGIVLTATGLAAPDRVYGFLGLASGVLLGGVGVLLLARALRQRLLHRTPDAAPSPPARALVSAGGGAIDLPMPRLLVGASTDRDHDHDHDHDHAHGGGHGHDHDHPHDNSEAHGHAHDAGSTEAAARHRHGLFSHTHAAPAVDRPLGIRSIVAMGFAGGLVPSPSALVVLLGAVALGRTWFGVVLVIAYGAGMAATLTGTGLLLSRASGRIGAAAAGFSPRMHRMMRVARLLPIATAAIVLTVGIGIAVQGLRAAL